MSATVSRVERRASESEKVSAQFENPTHVGAETPFQSRKLMPAATSMGPRANKKNSSAAGSSIRTVVGFKRCITPYASLIASFMAAEKSLGADASSTICSRLTSNLSARTGLRA